MIEYQYVECAMDKSVNNTADKQFSTSFCSGLTPRKKNWQKKSHKVNLMFITPLRLALFSTKSRNDI